MTFSMQLSQFYFVYLEIYLQWISEVIHGHSLFLHRTDTLAYLKYANIKMYSYRNRNRCLKMGEKMAYGSNYRSVLVGRTREMSKLGFINHNIDLKKKKKKRK